MTGVIVALSETLRTETRDAHVHAERSGMMRPLLRGRVERDRYVRLLASLYPIYVALEDGLASATALSAIRFPELDRRASLEADLDHLHGPDWSAIAPAPSAVALAERVTVAAADEPELLAAHAYVRYMGDLSGGTILGGILRKALGLDGSGTAFYAFPPPDPETWKTRFRDGLNTLAVDSAVLVEEALSAFRLHSLMFEELAQAP